MRDSTHPPMTPRLKPLDYPGRLAALHCYIAAQARARGSIPGTWGLAWNLTTERTPSSLGQPPACLPAAGSSCQPQAQFGRILYAVAQDLSQVPLTDPSAARAPQGARGESGAGAGLGRLHLLNPPAGLGRGLPYRRLLQPLPRGPARPMLPSRPRRFSRRLAPVRPARVGRAPSSRYRDPGNPRGGEAETSGLSGGGENGESWIGTGARKGWAKA
jgi:hypothetical protein